MKTRRFHVYAGREDLQGILKEFQETFDVYYVPTYSDDGPVSFRDAGSLEGLGTNFSGSHLGNQSKKLYDGLKRIVRRQSVKTVNGYFICKRAYENRGNYRFCTIDIKSPEEYDLKVE